MLKGFIQQLSAPVDRCDRCAYVTSSWLGFFETGRALALPMGGSALRVPRKLTLLEGFEQV